ncbi:MAG: bifunctional hydroxymethylpyrimidine kinase/phosphomethylpyrimidine kinase [Verrucomicrobiales bacterium]|nr:bifunctional hydroxymethylpyrimidine kinase/phosphomethylpyrimidine kinase [Verrucomicrobiales bacterium]
MNNTPNVLTIAGSDPCGGAGVQADIKVFHSLGVNGLSAITCITSQIPGHVNSVFPINKNYISMQIDLLNEHYQISAIKLGLLNSVESIEAILNSFNKFNNCPPIIIDPIINSSKGTIFLNTEALNLYKKELLPIASLYTPNLHEGETLLGDKNLTHEDMAKRLYHEFQSPVVLKGGHSNKEKAIDIYVDKNGVSIFESPMIRNLDPHGTGCFYSSSICALVALGYSIKEAISKSKIYITNSITTSANIGGTVNSLNYNISEFNTQL